MLINGKRALAYIVKIDEILPIENADKIEVARVGGWQVVVKKDEFKVGDLVVYIEVDSRVPSDKEEFAFLKDRKYKVKTIKLRGQVSQGLIMPVTILPEGEYPVGVDVTKALGIKKIEEEKPIINRSREDRLKNAHPSLVKKPWFKKMMHYKWFRKLAFKFLIPKRKSKSFPTEFEGVKITDQERCENMTWVLKDKRPFIVTTKIDGTSTTVVLDRRKRKEDLWVCSRNVRQIDRNMKNYHSVDGDDNVYWQVVDKFNLVEFLREMCKRFNLRWCAIQGETAGCSNGGAKLQGDPHKFGELRFFGYDLIFPDRGKINVVEAKKLCEDFGIEWVPIVDTNFILPDDFEEFKLQADGPCEAPGASGMREGYVYRLAEDCSFSFKNVSRKYLLKNDSY